eukprot:6033024-Amphidinium_carterae.1
MRSLLLTLNSVNLDIEWSNTAGSVPLSLFSNKLSTTNDLIALMASGSVPAKLFPENASTDNTCISPSTAGKVPDQVNEHNSRLWLPKARTNSVL